MPLTIGPCLVYAIYHSPLPFIRELLVIGADPNPAVSDGFPPLIAALSCSRSHQDRPDETILSKSSSSFSRFTLTPINAESMITRPCIWR